jgi:hypothetical protein
MGVFRVWKQDSAISHDTKSGGSHRALRRYQAHFRRINKGESSNSIVSTIHFIGAMDSQSNDLYIRIVSAIVNDVKCARLASRLLPSGRPRPALNWRGPKISPIDCRCGETWF